jgi:glycosyltransferase involved in cell wall biosynthesis
VLDGITGLRVDGESLDALETALARLLSERQEQARLADAALTRCVSEFSWTAVANKTRAIA